MQKERDERHEVTIPCGSVKLQGFLAIPEGAKGIVLFAHGSGSGRFSPRNQFVAEELAKAKFATLLMDLLTPDEERIDEITHNLRFDIALLTKRLGQVAQWVAKNSETKTLKIGYFGASTGAAVALLSQAEKQELISAVVSRGGRPDLAGYWLAKVTAPTLLIVGGNDRDVIELNKEAYDILNCEKHLEIVPGATHLFEEKGKLEEVAKLAKLWFEKYL
jgi:putative phosphoribosyl transferase